MNETATKRKYTDLTSLKANNLNAGLVRKWAAENNIAIPSRGRIPVAIVKQYITETVN